MIVIQTIQANVTSGTLMQNKNCGLHQNQVSAKEVYLRRKLTMYHGKNNGLLASDEMGKNGAMPDPCLRVRTGWVIFGELFRTFVSILTIFLHR